MRSQHELEEKNKHFWTINRARTALMTLKDNDGNVVDYIVLIDGGEVVFRNPNEKTYVIERLKQEGIPVLSQEDIKKRSEPKVREQLLKVYERMWTISKDKAKLLRVEHDMDNSLEYLISNEASQILHIPYLDLHEYVIQKMLEASVEIISARDADEQRQWRKIAIADKLQREKE